MTGPAVSLRHRFEDDPAIGFASPAEFIGAVFADRHAASRESVSDYRLRELTTREPGAPLAFLLPRAFMPATILAAAGSDEQGGYADRYGGFGVAAPRVTPWALGAVEGDPTAGRTLALPMDTPQLRVLARTDKDHSTSLSGGLTVTRTPETLPRTASRMELEAIDLRASSLFGFSWATEELLDAGPSAFAAILSAAYRDEFSGSVLREKIRGGGAGEYLGVLDAPATIEVAKEGGQAADTIVAENVLKMAEQCWGYDRAIWLANPDTRRELAALAITVGTDGHIPLFRPAAREGEPDMLFGRPAFFTEHASTLGDVGDLILGNWSQYLEGLYQPLQSAESIHVRWDEHERAFKFWLRNAGAPWWRSALTPANGANDLSPFVVLAERA